MASGSFLFDISSGTNADMWQARCSWSSTPNASSNTSYVTMSIQARNVAGQNAMSKTYSGSYEVWNNSTDSSVVSRTTFTLSKSITDSWTTLKTFSFTTSHDSSGNCILYPVMDVTQDYALGYSAWLTSRDITVSLGSTRQKATITSAPNFTEEDSPTLYYSNPMGSSVSALEACIADSTGYTIYVPYRSVSKTSGSYTFNFTESERNALISAVGNGTTASVRFYLRTTIAGNYYLSYSTKTLTVEVGGPVITASIVDVDPTTTALTGGGDKFIPGRNSMQFSVSATGQKGATITKYYVVCGNKSSTATSGTLTNIENNVVIFSATDSRGVTATKTVQLTAIDYIKLTCNQELRMVLESENAAQVDLTVTGNYFNGSFGAQKNTLTLYVRSQEEGGTWSSWGDISILINDISNNTYTAHANVSGLNPNRTYTFQCKAVDALGEVVTTEYAVKLKPVFDWGKTDFNFNVPITIEGNPLVDFVIEEGTEAMGTNGTWYWRKWASGRADCYGVRNYGNMAVSTAWGGLYRSESFSQSLPYGLFIATPEVVDITYRVANYGGWIARHEATEASSDNTGGFIVVRPASATLNQAHIGFNVIGRWK